MHTKIVEGVEQDETIGEWKKVCRGYDKK
jgi:hypothetical protein